MGKNKLKTISVLIIIFSIISISITSYGHSGKTDSNGGHKDNKNKSGLGSYHYHCGGYPAHLHEDGTCPYSMDSKLNKSSTSNSSSSETETSYLAPSTIPATGISINENIGSMKKGESYKLTATIKPDNVTDKNITWESSDREVVYISKSGEITAKKTGTVEIIATTANGKTSTITIKVLDAPKIENTSIIKTSTTSKNNITNNNTTTKYEEEDILTEIITVGLLGGGYWGYKKLKKPTK